MPFKYSQRVIREGRRWTDNQGVTHPGNWMNWSDETKAEKGLVWEEPAQPFDNKYYWGRDTEGNLIPRALEDTLEVDELGDPLLDEDGVQIVTPGLKTQAIKKVKEQANSYIKPYEWFFTREIATGIIPPTEVKAYRQAVVNASNTMEVAITACLDLEEFKALSISTADVDGNITSLAVLQGWPEYGDTVGYVPDQVSMRQARLALLGAGLLDTVNTLITDPAESLEWEFAQIVKRNSPLINTLSGALGLTSAEVDALFITAEQL